MSAAGAPPVKKNASSELVLACRWLAGPMYSRMSLSFRPYAASTAGR